MFGFANSNNPWQWPTEECAQTFLRMVRRIIDEYMPHGAPLVLKVSIKAIEPGEHQQIPLVQYLIEIKRLSKETGMLINPGSIDKSILTTSQRNAERRLVDEIAAQLFGTPAADDRDTGDK